MPPIQQENEGRLQPWDGSAQEQAEQSPVRHPVTTVAVMLARLSGLTALATAALAMLGHNLPLAGHMIPGVVLVAALAILTLHPRITAPGLLVASVLTLAAIPLLGLMELGQVSEGMLWALRVLHPAAGLAGIALAEMQAKRIRRA